MNSTTRWVRFNLVGVAGFIVQMLTLGAITRWAGMEMHTAVPVAVLVAVSHNFLWHEHITWPGQLRAGRMRRWVSFNLSTGVISVMANVILTTLVVAATGAPLLAANAAAVVIASVVNFHVTDRYVFTRDTPNLMRCAPLRGRWRRN